MAGPMEADWEIEIDGDAPLIDARWSGFVDLLGEPERARELAESQRLPALADALMRLNAPNSPVWTSKCDVFVPDHFDSDELDAPGGVAVRALACYVDLLSMEERRWNSVEALVTECRRLCDRLRRVPLRSCRADLVIRSAMLERGVDAFGVTVYIAAAGRDEPSAANTMAEALAAFADAARAQFAPDPAS